MNNKKIGKMLNKIISKIIACFLIAFAIENTLMEFGHLNVNTLTITISLFFGLLILTLNKHF